MSRISPHALVSAVVRVRAMDLTQKEQLADELFRAQPPYWLQRVVPEEFDKFVVMTALNFAECIAFVPLPAQTKPVRRTQCVNVVAPRRGEFERRA